MAVRRACLACIPENYRPREVAAALMIGAAPEMMIIAFIVSFEEFEE